jgi:hypothetical protein
MDGLGDILGGLFGGLFENADVASEVAMGVGEQFFSPNGDGRGQPGLPIVYERYLCGAPRQLNINDR